MTSSLPACVYQTELMVEIWAMELVRLVMAELTLCPFSVSFRVRHLVKQSLLAELVHFG